jgi:hypothetical protein
MTFMGRQKKENTTPIHYRIDVDAAESLKEIAIDCGFRYAGKAAMGAFLERLAKVDRDLLKVILKQDLDR